MNGRSVASRWSDWALLIESASVPKLLRGDDVFCTGRSLLAEHSGTQGVLVWRVHLLILKSLMICSLPYPASKHPPRKSRLTADVRHNGVKSFKGQTEHLFGTD